MSTDQLINIILQIKKSEVKKLLNALKLAHLFASNSDRDFFEKIKMEIRKQFNGN